MTRADYRRRLRTECGHDPRWLNDYIDGRVIRYVICLRCHMRAQRIATKDGGE